MRAGRLSGVRMTWALVALVAVAVSGCGSSGGSPRAASSVAPLAGTTWRITGATSDGKTLRTPRGNRPYLRIDHGRASAKVCNSMSGAAKVAADGRSVEFGDWARTDMWCTRLGDLEQAVVSVLHGKVGVGAGAGGGVTLTAPGGGAVRLRQVPAP
jgi:heat shock protein HslJ